MAAVDMPEATDIARYEGFKSSRVYVGPRTVQIDISNPCNLSCACCWTYSPLVRPADTPFLRRRLNPEQFYRLIDELEALGTRGINLAGVGDPVTHPQIDDLLTYAKRQGMHVSVTTNGTLFSERRLKLWASISLDWVSVSVLGADQDTWSRMHPSDNAKLYERMYNSLITLKMIKEAGALDNPGVSLTQVICSLTINNLEQTVRMAATVGASFVGFYGLDSFKEIRSIELKASDLPALRTSLTRANAIAHELGVETNIETVFAILEGSEGRSNGRLQMPRIPCYHGWVFARIMADGSVYPCCGAVGRAAALGNINERTFSAIWHSKRYGDFRRCGKFLWEDDQAGFRKRIGCKHCPDIDLNVGYHELFKQLNDHCTSSSQDQG